MLAGLVDWLWADATELNVPVLVGSVTGTAATVAARKVIPNVTGRAC